MKLKRTLLVYRKELKDILRDRRTLLSMILLPILIIPLFYLGFGAFMKSRMDKLKEKPSTIVWIAPDEVVNLRIALEKSDGVNLITGITDTATAKDMLREKEVDAVVFILEGFIAQLTGLIKGDESAERPVVKVFLDETRQTSEFAARKVTSALTSYRSDLVSGELAMLGMRPELIQPFMIDKENIASPEEMGSMVVGFILPYIIILMVLTGAMYPAIDLTAGEKERGTLETLLVSGVSRGDIVGGKFLTVLTASIITAILAIGSMAFTFSQGITMFEEVSNVMSFEFDPLVPVILLISILPLAVIFSALLMTLGLFAKSYREAQTYISPLMILIIIPAMASAVPDIEMTYKMALIPVLNVSLQLKEALSGTIDYGIMATSMTVNFILAGLALFLVLRMFRRESVLFRI